MRPLSNALVLVAVVAMLAACTPGPSGGPSQTQSPSPVASVVVHGRVHAGPTCPVQKVPPDPACDDRSVDGAVLIVTTGAGGEVARTTSAPDGTFDVALPPGDYVLVPQPVNGLMGTARPLPFHAQADGAAPAPLDVAYDTGIR